MAAEAEWQAQIDKAAAAMAAAGRAATQDGTIPAMAREAMKDVRNTLHEVFFGRGEGSGEPGAPLNPTQGEIAADRRQDQHPYGPMKDAAQTAPSPGDIAYGRGVHGQEPARGSVHGQEGPLPSPGDIAYGRAAQGQDARDSGQVLQQEKWVDRVADKQPEETWGKQIQKEHKGEDEDQNERARGRSLPEELRQQKEEIERGGRCR